jgi:hypothetical protein
MLFDSLYTASWMALWWSADDLPAFWRLLGDGSNEIQVAYDMFMEHREVLNELVSVGLHVGENDMSAALASTYMMNSATQKLCIAFRDAVVAPVLWEAKHRCEIDGSYPGGPPLRCAVLKICSELFGSAFSGSRLEDLMLLAIDKRFKQVEMAGKHTGQQAFRPFLSLTTSRRRRHGRGRTDAREAYMSGTER